MQFMGFKKTILLYLCRSSEAKLNNFTRLQLTFKLLCLPFNANVVSDHTSMIWTTPPVGWAGPLPLWDGPGRSPYGMGYSPCGMGWGFSGSLSQYPLVSIQVYNHGHTPSPLQARDVMTGKTGAAVQLMYQIYMALNRKTVSGS